MANNVLQADAHAADAFLTKNLGSPAPPWWIQFDLLILHSAFTAIFGLVSQFSGDFIEIGGEADGIFLTGWDTGGTPHTFEPSGNRNYFTDQGSFVAPINGGFADGVWTTIKVHYDGTTTKWYADGALIFTNTVSLSLSDIQFGAIFAAHLAGEVYYLDNLKIGTTDGGSDIFCEDFEGGSFSQWSSTTGAVSIVADPGSSPAPSPGCAATTLSASFTGTPLTGTSPLTVVFTDTSTPGPSGPIVAWHWDFGDGHTSSAQNPSHSYQPGIFTVSLTVTGTSPDGTDTDTKTDYIAARVPATNTDCDHATQLQIIDCPTGSLVIDTSDYPDSQAPTDPLLTIYGAYAVRESWYRFQNTSGGPAYVRFQLTCLSKAGVRLDTQFGVFSGPSCAALVNPNDVPVNDPMMPDHVIADIGSTIDIEYNFQSLLVGDDFAIRPGLQLQAGETVYLAVATDDSVSEPRSRGTLRLDWTIVTVTRYDTTDVRRPASEGAPLVGESDVFPPHTQLDTSGFAPNAPVVDPLQGMTNVLAYIRHNGFHWVAVINQVRSLPDPPDGVLYETQLGVWQIDDTGAEVNFTILDSFIGNFSHSVSINDYGSEFMQPNGDGQSVRFASDGANLWCCTYAREPVPNPYDSTIPPHSWNPAHVAVYANSGGGWARIGALDAQTNNSSNGQDNDRFAAFDCCASPTQPGVMHVVMSERGQTGGDDAQAPPQDGFFGSTPLLWLTLVSHATFSPGGLTSQSNLFFSSQLNSDPHLDAIQTEESAYIWVRNDDGNPLFVWLVPRTDGTPGYKFQCDIYTLGGGLIKSIGHAETDPVLPFATVMRDAWLSFNAEVDDFDGRRCYFLNIDTDSGGVFLRLPVADLANPRYIDDVPADSSATFTPNLPSAEGSVYSDPGGLWVPSAALSTDPAHFIRCLQQWDGPGLGWLSAPTATHYPALHDSTFGTWLSPDDFFYYGGAFEINNDTHYGTRYNSVNRTKILRDWYICTLGPEARCSEGFNVWDRIAWVRRQS